MQNDLLYNKQIQDDRTTISSRHDHFIVEDEDVLKSIEGDISHVGIA